MVAKKFITPVLNKVFRVFRAAMYFNEWCHSPFSFVSTSHRVPISRVCVWGDIVGYIYIFWDAESLAISRQFKNEHRFHTHLVNKKEWPQLAWDIVNFLLLPHELKAKTQKQDILKVLKVAHDKFTWNGGGIPYVGRYSGLSWKTFGSRIWMHEWSSHSVWVKWKDTNVT